MILSNECFLYDSCKRYRTGECKLDNAQFCIKLFRLNYLYKESLLSERQKEYVGIRVDADGTDREVFTKLKDFEKDIERFVKDGRSLYLYSRKCGNGKTLWATRMIQAYFNAIWHKCDLNCKALFINVPRLLLALKDNISNKSEYVEHIKQNVQEADLVVWDEIGTKAVSTFEHEHLLSFINSRIDNNKSQIFTSNLDPASLKEAVGERLYSRVINTSFVFEFKGADKRGLAR